MDFNTILTLIVLFVIALATLAVEMVVLAAVFSRLYQQVRAALARRRH